MRSLSTDVSDLREPLPTGAVALGTVYLVAAITGLLWAVQDGAEAGSALVELVRFGDLLGSSAITFLQVTLVESALRAPIGLVLSAGATAAAIRLFADQQTRPSVIVGAAWGVTVLLFGLADVGLMLALPGSLLAERGTNAIGPAFLLPVLGALFWFSNAASAYGLGFHLRARDGQTTSWEGSPSSTRRTSAVSRRTRATRRSPDLSSVRSEVSITVF